jgi:ribosomal protein S18 acetylase RimI-like enzyme
MIRLATMHDVLKIMSMIDQARVILASHQSGQWQGEEPSLATLLNDIKQSQYWVLELQDTVVAGASLASMDVDYQTLKEGTWLNHEPYRVIHRMVVDASIHRQGIGKMLLDNLENLTRQQNIYSIKIDTHARNIPMIGLLKKAGYVRCGIVILKGHLIREAFQKILR